MLLSAAVREPFLSLGLALAQRGTGIAKLECAFHGSVRVQLAITKEVILRLESACDRRQLTMHEEELRQALKLKALGLASLQLTIAR
jgi:hypothetical protein